MLVAGTSEFLLFTLILMRMSGFIFLNPVLGRRNIPAMIKTGMTIMLAIIIYPAASMEETAVSSALVYGMLLLKEFAIGYMMGFAMQLFDMALTYAGTVIDFQMGLSMATVYDPQNGTQTALTGSILQIYYLLLFFAVDGHLALMKIIMTSGDVVPYAQIRIGNEAAEAVVSIFLQCIVLAVKLSMPFIAFEFLLEVGIGILAKIIPQMNLFVLNIQLRVILGVLMLLLLISPIGDYVGNLVTMTISTVQDILNTVAG